MDASPISTPRAQATDKNVIPDEDKELLIKILSCRNLFSSDSTGLSDPYVKAKVGKKTWHKTTTIKKTLNPVFSAEHKNSFVLNCTAKELFENQGLELEVKDYDGLLGKNDVLGSAMVPAESLYSAKEEVDMEFQLVPPKGINKAAGFVTIRVRPPSLGDREAIKAQKSLLGMMGLGKKKEKEPEQREQAQASNLPRMSILERKDKILSVEILSCRDILAADKTATSDPYVKVKMDGKDLHETKYITKTLNPVFSEETNNSFILDCPAADLFSKNGILLKVKDWDRGYGGNDDLGSVQISADVLYDFGKEPREFQIDPPSGKSDAAGFITILCSEITAEERDSKKKGGVFQSLRSCVTKARDDTVVTGDLHLLVEIGSCQNLIIADINSSDPYVKVKMGSTTVHKTKFISSTQDPVYTIKTDSLFILDVTKEEFLAAKEGLTFIVKDYDSVGLKNKNEEIGHVQVPPQVLCDANGERMVLKLLPTEGSKHKEAGVISIRCRPATNYDRKFLEYAKGDNKGDFLDINRYTNILMKPHGGSTELIKSKRSVVEKTGPDAGVKKYLIRPEPDPKREAVTKWLSNEDIQKEALKASHRWIDVGSGNLGRLFVEVIGADGLPNLDSSVTGSDKSDTFAMLVYEDCCAKTDIIDDCLSPRWLPWMQRAFIFNVDHASSDIFVGIFDHDPAISGDHDMIGRCVIEISNLRPNTEYTLSYNLYEDSYTKLDREPKGSITLRIRVEFESQKELILSNLKMPSEKYVNVKSKKDFHVVRQVVEGKTDLRSYSLSTLLLYVDEIFSYLFVQLYIMDAAISLLFWRGQVPFYFGINLPLHSMIAFYAAITLVERPTLWFSYFWLGNAWLLLAIQNWRSNTPPPWNRSKSFGQVLRMMILDKAMTKTEKIDDGSKSFGQNLKMMILDKTMIGPEQIEANQNEIEATEYETKMRERMAKAEAEAEKRREDAAKELAEHEKEMAALDPDADISTREEKNGFDPLGLKYYLYPYQQMLASICHGVRFLRNVYLWDEPYIAFYLAAASIVVGLVFLIVPWAFLMRWTGRIIAWGVFGPHMKAVDIFWFSKLKGTTEEEETKLAQTKLAQYYKSLREQARIQTEENLKLKAIKNILYGKYVVRVPVTNTERIRDLPLHKSSAKPYTAPDEPTKISELKIGGQQLVGNMIPQLRFLDDEKKAEAEAPVAEKKTL